MAVEDVDGIYANAPRVGAEAEDFFSGDGAEPG